MNKTEKGFLFEVIDILSSVPAIKNKMDLGAYGSYYFDMQEIKQSVLRGLVAFITDDVAIAKDHIKEAQGYIEERTKQGWENL